jgi:hypothetical protein
MTKYFIEENINFYEELYKSLGKEDKQENSDYCLISNQPLIENYVTMCCGHKFNYQPLFYDILNHKKKFNSMERHHLRSSDIRCPYCRNVQKKLLPYIEGYPKVHGVNFFDDSTSKTQNTNKVNSMKLVSDGYIVGDCCYETSKIGENGEVIKCTNNMVKMFTNNNFYCPQHKYMMLKKIMQENKLKNKLKLKEEKKKTKEEEKMKKLEEKMKLKAEQKKSKLNSVVVNLDENTVVTNEIVGCSQVLKTGEKKGTACKCKVFKDGMCKRHYGLLNKNDNVVAVDKEPIIIDLTKEE